MSQPTAKHANDHVLLFQGGGEFAEFADVLSDLEVPTDTFTGNFPRPSDLEDACLVIAPGSRLLQTGTPDLRCWPRTFAVIDDASKTLVSQLNRIGVAMVIRRPVHPRALRLLLLHEIYRGPERRDRKRVLIGHPIRIGTGLFKTRATLLELSPTGARAEVANPPRIGSEITILFGKELTRGRPQKLRARVVRCIRSRNDGKNDQSEIGIRLLDGRKHSDLIKSILDRFAMGPAPWKAKNPRRRTGSTAPAHAPREVGNPTAISRVPATPTAAQDPTSEIPDPSTALPRPVERKADSPPQSSLPRIHAPATEPRPASREDERDAAHADPGNSSDRRNEDRVPYEERIVALGEEATRVLVGRDLSPSGMRIASTPSVAIGDILRVALHGGTETEPLIVLAHALRDDGEAGIVLLFKDLSPLQRERIGKIIAMSPPIHAAREDDDEQGDSPDSIVVAEMLETVHRESDAEIDEHLDSIFSPYHPPRPER